MGAIASPQQQLNGLQMGVRSCNVQGGVALTVLGRKVNPRLEEEEEDGAGIEEISVQGNGRRRGEQTWLSSTLRQFTSPVEAAK